MSKSFYSISVFPLSSFSLYHCNIFKVVSSGQKSLPRQKFDPILPTSRHKVCPFFHLYNSVPRSRTYFRTSLFFIIADLLPGGFYRYGIRDFGHLCNTMYRFPKTFILIPILGILSL